MRIPRELCARKIQGDYTTHECVGLLATAIQSHISLSSSEEMYVCVVADGVEVDIPASQCVKMLRTKAPNSDAQTAHNVPVLESSHKDESSSLHQICKICMTYTYMCDACGEVWLSRILSMQIGSL